MTRFVLVLFLTAGLHILVNAQAPKDSATQRAVHQLRTMEKQLHLNQDQVLQLQVILINRDVAMDSLHNQPSGDKKTDNHARRAIQQNADQKINAILTDDQKPLYQQFKEKQKEKMQAKRQQTQAGGPVNNPNQ